MGKLVDLFFEWAKNERRWPLLAILTVPAIFKAVQEYFQLSFRETTVHWSFLISTGIVSLLVGAIYSTVNRQQIKERGWLGAILGVLGLSLITVGALQLRPPALTSDRLVVGVARFTPVSAGARDDADNLSHLIAQTLRAKQKAGIRLQVKQLPLEVIGADETARRNAAVALAMSRDGAAHVILWGDVRRDESELYVEPHLTVARPLGKQLPEAPSLSSYTSEGPNHITFKRQLSTEIVDTISFTIGLGRFNAGRWDEAEEIFAQVNSPPSHLYHGMSLLEKYIANFQKTFDYKSGLVTLNAAEAELLVANKALMDVNDLNLLGLSLLKLGDALRMRSDWDGALKHYENAEAVAVKAGDSIREAAARIGKARTKLLGSRDLDGATGDVERAILLYGQHKDTGGLANALNWKGIIQGSRGDLNEAVESLNQAVAVAKHLEDRGLLFYSFLERANVYLKMTDKYAAERMFDKTDSAADRAESDYKRALTVAEALGWKGLAQQTSRFLAELAVRRELIKAQGSKSSGRNG